MASMSWGKVMPHAGACPLVPQAPWGKLRHSQPKENKMIEDEDRKRPRTHEVGMVLDALSIEELEARIALLETEIGRLRAAIDAKGSSRKAAEAAFKF
jgi:uncharacterized small protein (DUF1192 family)